MTKKKFFIGAPTDILEESIESVSKETQRIKVYLDKRSYGKLVTIIEGIEPSEAKSVLKELKSILSCGGTFKDGKIELRGDHTDKIKKILVELGFSEGNIDVERLL